MYAHSCTQMYVSVGYCRCDLFFTAHRYSFIRSCLCNGILYTQMCLCTYIHMRAETETFSVINSKAGQGETALCSPVSRRATGIPNTILFHFQVCFWCVAQPVLKWFTSSLALTSLHWVQIKSIITSLIRSEVFQVLMGALDLV